MKKIILITILFFTLMALPSLVFAQTEQIDVLRGGVDKSAVTSGLVPADLQSEDLQTRIGSIMNFWFSVIGVVFLMIVLLGGIRWMTAGGNDEKVQQAVKIIIGGVEGMIITFMAYVILFVALNALRYVNA